MMLSEGSDGVQAVLDKTVTDTAKFTGGPMLFPTNATYGSDGRVSDEGALKFGMKHPDVTYGPDGRVSGDKTSKSDMEVDKIINPESFKQAAAVL